MPFCPNCGIQVEAKQNFCPNCGQRLSPVPSPPAQGIVAPIPQATQMPPPAYTPPPVPQVGVGERIVAIVPNLKKPKSFGRWDTYNLIVTERRCIFAALTGDMLNKAIKEANEQGKAQGKGLMDRWGDQMQSSVGYWHRYESMEPEVALRENKENFSFDISAVKTANYSRRDRMQGKVRLHYWEVQIETRGEKYKLESDFDPSEAMSRSFGIR